MSSVQTTNYENILKIIHHWPPPKRLTLVQDILSTLTSELEVSEPTLPRIKHNTLKDALGLLATDQPPPSDEEVQMWLDEHRLEKYG